MNKGLGFVWLVVFGVVGLFAQTELVGTDRPGFGDGTSIMTRGDLQMEAGMTYTDQDDVDTFNFGELLFRYGLNDTFELRVSLNSYVDAGNPLDDSGREDAGVGFKAALFSNDISALTFVGGATFDNGDDGFSNEETVANAALSWAASITDKFGYSAYVNYQDSDVSEILASASLGWDLNGVGFTTGYGGFFPEEGDDRHFFEANATFPIASNQQVDVNAGIGLNDENDGFFIGAGYAWHF